jgi:hypothetical protein
MKLGKSKAPSFRQGRRGSLMNTTSIISSPARRPKHAARPTWDKKKARRYRQRASVSLRRRILSIMDFVHYIRSRRVPGSIGPQAARATALCVSLCLDQYRPMLTIFGPGFG